MIGLKLVVSALALVAASAVSLAASDNTTAMTTTLPPHASINCVCWGPCCASCIGKDCPKRRALEEYDDDGDSPFVWANVGANGVAVRCRQRAYGLECPRDDAP